MKIRTKLTLIFLSIITLLLGIFCTAIYLESEIYRQNEYEIRLRQEAQTVANAIIKKEKTSLELLGQMAKNKMTVLSQEKIEIFNQANQKVYQSGVGNNDIDSNILAKIRQNKELFWEENDNELFGMVFNNNGEEFIVYATAIDKYGIRKQKNLALMLITGSLTMLIISAISGNFFVGLMLNPIKKMIKKIDTITERELSLRLNEGNKKDEFAQLSIRFNQMIDRLQQAFKGQHSLIASASHELRTPLTSITGQIQVSLMANDNPDELKTMINSVLDDVQQLNKLTNNLLDLTSIEINDTSLQVKLVNVGIILHQIQNELLAKKPNFKIYLNLNEINDLIPQVQANESLLYVALMNLIENGAKFSPINTVNVDLKVYEKSVRITIQNDTPIIPEYELATIFEPFKRGANTKKIKGHGIGLSLTKRIIELHSAKLKVQSNELDGTVFEVVLFKKIRESSL
jgi:signal transduction histidine kinase